MEVTCRFRLHPISLGADLNLVRKRLKDDNECFIKIGSTEVEYAATDNRFQVKISVVITAAFI